MPPESKERIISLSVPHTMQFFANIVLNAQIASSEGLITGLWSCGIGMGFIWSQDMMERAEKAASQGHKKRAYLGAFWAGTESAAGRIVIASETGHFFFGTRGALLGGMSAGVAGIADLVVNIRHISEISRQVQDIPSPFLQQTRI